MTTEAISAEDYNALVAGQKRGPKYGNRQTEVDGIGFDSKAEAKRYTDLRLLEVGGAITDLVLQPRFPLMVNGEKVGVYVADFQYVEDGRLVVEDVKGGAATKTPVYRLKVKLMAAIHGITVEEIGG
jgi:hypothetical protein